MKDTKLTEQELKDLDRILEVIKDDINTLKRDIDILETLKSNLEEHRDKDKETIEYDIFRIRKALKFIVYDVYGYNPYFEKFDKSLKINTKFGTPCNDCIDSEVAFILAKRASEEKEQEDD